MARNTLAFPRPLKGEVEESSTPHLVKRSPVLVLEQGSSSASSSTTDSQQHREEDGAGQAQAGYPIDTNRSLRPHLSDQEYVMTLVGDDSGRYRWPDWVPRPQGSSEEEAMSSHTPQFYRGESSRSTRQDTASNEREEEDNADSPLLEDHFDDLQISGQTPSQQQQQGRRARQRRERTRQAHADQAARLTEMDLKSEVDATRAELNALMQIPGIQQGYTGDLQSLRGRERQQEIELRYDAERQLIRYASRTLRGGGQGRESSMRLLLQPIAHGISRVLVDNYNSQVQSLQHLLLQRSSLRQDSHSTDHIDTLIRSQAYLARQTFRSLQRRLRNVQFKYAHLMEQLRPQRTRPVGTRPRAP